MSSHTLRIPVHPFVALRLFLGALLCCFVFSVGAAPADSSKSSTSDPAKTEVKQAKKTAGLVKKLFSKLSKWVSGADKAAKEAKKAEAGVSSYVNKKGYKHRYVHLRHRQLKNRNGQLGFSDSSGNSPPSDTIPYLNGKKFNRSGEVFGWHPHWVGDAYKAYNFSLLSTVAYFSYEVDPATGNYKNIYDWKTTPMIDMARKAGCNVLLTITNFGDSENTQFLNNSTAQETLIKQVLGLLKERNAQGICVDFEGIPSTDKKAFNNFLVKLGFALHQDNPDYLLYLALYPVDWNDIYDFPVLDPHVNRFVIMGYGYYGSGSKTAGPVAPLQSGSTWWEYNIEKSVATYISAGAKANKLILAVPYYGDIWETSTLDVPGNAVSFLDSRNYSYISTTFKSKATIDTASQSAYYAYIAEGNKKRQCWFDNVQTLGAKYAYIKKKKLAGVGIWALGYDNGTEDLWKLLATHFSKAPGDTSSAGGDSTATAGTTPADTTGTATSPTDATLNKVEAVLQWVFNYKLITVFVLVYLLVVCSIAFLLALGNCQTRVYFYNLKAFRVYYIAFSTLVVLIAVRYIGLIDNSSLLVLFGILIGVAITLLANRKVGHIKRNTP